MEFSFPQLFSGFFFFTFLVITCLCNFISTVHILALQSFQGLSTKYY